MFGCLHACRQGQDRCSQLSARYPADVILMYRRDRKGRGEGRHGCSVHQLQKVFCPKAIGDHDLDLIITVKQPQCAIIPCTTKTYTTRKIGWSVLVYFGPLRSQSSRYNQLRAHLRFATARAECSSIALKHVAVH